MDFEAYLSPFTWRYASKEMRSIWSETNKRRLWRRIWVVLAEVQSSYQLVTPEQLAELKLHAQDINMERALEIESQIHHDLMAELKTYAEQCPQAGGILHMGATSMDIEDNTDALRLTQALDLLLERLQTMLILCADRLDTWADLPVMGFTHIQPAEPTTLGYRFAFYVQDWLADWQRLKQIRQEIRGKGFKGAVGTAAGYAELLGAEQFDTFEQQLSRLLDLPFFSVANQTYPRRQDYQVISSLAGLGSSLYKFAVDLRLLQSPPIGELSEPFGKQQVGSSAMPFKRNPIQAEKINSLARQLSVLPQIAWHNAAQSFLERTLDDSANRRTVLPEAFLICDELLITATRILRGMVVNQTAIDHNLESYGPFASTERLLMQLVKAGADRQEMHARLREHALYAWDALQQGKANPLLDKICSDTEITHFFPPDRIREIMKAEDYLGIAAQRSRQMAEEIRQMVSLPSTSLS